jgi:hypothetical protein
MVLLSPARLMVPSMSIADFQVKMCTSCPEPISGAVSNDLLTTGNDRHARSGTQLYKSQNSG